MSPETIQRQFDVGIVGGGPAGLSAAIWLGRFLHDVVVFDSMDPRNWETRGIHGFLGHEGITPAKIRGHGRDECRRYGIRLVDAHVDAVEHHGVEQFDLRTDSGEQFSVRRLLLAMGIHDDWPEIPGLQDCYGTTVHTCPNCDGYESTDTRAAVLGTGRRAATVALALLTWTDEVTIYTNGDPAGFDAATADTIERTNIGVEIGPIARLHHRRHHLREIVLESGQSRRAQRLFIAMGQHARDDLGAQLGCDRDDLGFVVIDPHHHTSVYNVFAAGDITPGAQLAVRAAAGGTEAALSIHHSLIPQQRRVHRSC